MSRIKDGKIYETEAEHDHRIRRANWRFARDKKQSRSRTRSRRIRRICFQRAEFKCEICRFEFQNVLILHHIMPVQLGGLAHDANLIVLCPNCHALTHNYSHYGRSQYSERKYPAWIGALAKAGLSEEQAKRLILIASKDARIMRDGSVVPYREPGPLTSIIVDDEGKPVDPRHNPEKIEAALQRIEKMFGIGRILSLNNPETVGD